MRKGKWVIILLTFIIAFTGCTKKESSDKALERYSSTFLSLFDTVTSIVGYAESEEEFNIVTKQIHDEMLNYHKLYDIYNSYDGIVNIKNINESAGIAPIKVDQKIIDLLLFSKEIYKVTNQKVNIALGSVLSLWHEAREDGLYDPINAYLPDMDELIEASKHTNLDKVIVDDINNTVFFEDPEIKLDVGAIAKGYATQKAIENIDISLLISVGGNVASTRSKIDGSPWIVGLQDTQKSEGTYKQKVNLNKGAVVTSGDYQRYYEVDGVLYHHIIDPDTLMPGKYWKAVSVIVTDSGLADGLSTALFLMNQEEGQKLLDKYSGFALWTDENGNEYKSRDFDKIVKN